ncbi:transport protein Avl9-domain-containing protein [Mycena rebaudengoi]|nr:transport protein Avl9-domain-containing protein [Mycena rebaudengoi]
MSLEATPHPAVDIHGFLAPGDDDDADTASQRSISLSSPALSPRNSVQAASQRSPDTFSNRISTPYTLDTDLSSEPDDSSTFTRELGLPESPNTSAAPSVYEEPIKDHESIASFASGSSRKARPESMLVLPGDRPVVLGIALVDFNHLVGPRIEYSTGDIFDDEEVCKILPFLALPDGAHLSAEDYSYFHLVPSGPYPTTQIAASALLVKTPDVTRSTVQKAVVVLASKPVFGPIRDKLGVVTTALFNQRDFRETNILDDFAESLESSLRGQLTESGLYMGTNLRELVHTFRQRTLILVKALMLQKRIMFYGHPVERLCTYQYSLVSLLPGLLQTLDDCGSPPLAARAPTLSRPTELRTSDHKSMMAYTGLPLDIFGKDAFFQPYLPLQQLDVAKDTKSWLCGSTNSIVTQRPEVDLLVNTETGVFEFRDPKLERSAGLTAADRKWMDDIVKDVNDGWSDEEGRPVSMMFKGSDDYLRTKFEEYISAALSSVRYRDFMAKGNSNGVITGGTGSLTPWEDFNPLWISEFKHTNAYEVWERTTDPMLFDIVEPRHPCNEKVSVVTDIGLRLQEGLQDLKLEQQLAPAREAVAQALTVGSTNFFKAVEGVRGRWNAQRESLTPSEDGSKKGSRASTPVEVTKADVADAPEPATPAPSTARPLLLARKSTVDTTPPPAPRPSISSWGSGFGSFITNRASKFSLGGIGKSADMPPPIVTTPESPHSASTPSFLGTMTSPSGIRSPSVFPPTPVAPISATSTPVATLPPSTLPSTTPAAQPTLLSPSAAQPPAPIHHVAGPAPVPPPVAQQPPAAPADEAPRPAESTKPKQADDDDDDSKPELSESIPL